MVEAIANGIEDQLIDGLSFKMQPGASYIVDRRSVTYHPQGSNIYTPTRGTKLIRILLNSWLDVNTFRIQFDVRNNAATGNKLYVLGGPHCFFRRMRILCSGQLVEDIDNYNRVHEMMSLLISSESRDNNAAEAFGKNWDSTDGGITPGTGFDTTVAIEGQQSLTVLFKPLSGLLNQNKMLPIRYAPVTLELKFADSNFEAIVDSSGNANDLFLEANTSTDWQIENVQVKVDVCTLDNALDNSYAQHLLSGKSLPISYNTFVSQIQTANPTDKNLINVSRALTRLKSVFVTLFKDIPETTTQRKFWNNFFSPMAADQAAGLKHNSNGEFEFQLQIGSKLFPEYPIRSHNEAFYQLAKTLGVQASAVHNFDITAREYRHHKFILGTDCEKVLDAGFTGLNTRAGDLMTVKFDYRSLHHTGSDNARRADRIHIVLHSDQIMEIRDSGVQVYD
jgi:hypothetical protein